MTKLDPRIHAFRDDLADAELEGLVGSQNFTCPEKYTITAPSTFVKQAPDEQAQILTQALSGEDVNVFDVKNGWAWGQLIRDKYVGYIPLADLEVNNSKPVCKVIVKHTHIYPEPDIKTHPKLVYNLGALLSGEIHSDKFFRTNMGGYIIRAHLAPIDMIETDFVTVAENFTGAPYLWGGKTSFGLDCSGLVQISLQAAGEEAPRDSDMQADVLGTPLHKNSWERLKRGDLVFWKGHVGIMCDEKILLHANGHHMLVVREPLQKARDRIASEYGDITQINRF